MATPGASARRRSSSPASGSRSGRGRRARPRARQCGRAGAAGNLHAAARLLGPEDCCPAAGLLIPAGFEIDPVFAHAGLAEFYAFSADVLRRLRAGMDAGEEASEIILWPEHFDIAFEAGPEAARQRANYGASPGDEQHAGPYLYVGPWTSSRKASWVPSAFQRC